MARLNVEADLFLDPRFKRLVLRVGGERLAMGLLIEFLFVAQKYWGESRSLIPHDVFDVMDAEVLVEVKLAVREEGGVYAKGAKDHFEWYAQKKEAASIGGQKSAEARKLKFGSAIPKNAPYNTPNDEKIDTKIEAKSNCSQAKSNPLTPSLTHINNNYNNDDKEIAEDDKRPRQLFELWRQINPDRPVHRLSSVMRKKIKTRLFEEPDFETWKRCFELIRDTVFLKDKKWPTFDWLMENDNNYVKVLSGKYDMTPKQKPKREINYIPLLDEQSPEGETA